MHDDSEISSWLPAQEAVQFSNVQGLVRDEQNSVAQFYSTSSTSLYLTLLDVLSPAARVGLKCYQYEELINHIGQSLSHGKGSQFETFYARLKIPFGIEDLGSLVVVKRIRRDVSEKTATLRRWDSLRREFQVLCHPPFRDHENIVKLLAFGWEQDYAAPILIQEYADLGTLGSYLDTNEGLAWEVRRRLCLDVASGIQALHAADIIHGDVKPNNILMFSMQDEQWPRAKITDFGMIIAETTSDSEYYLGTTLWIPPEAWKQEKIPIKNLKACDIFSMGLVFWAILRNSSYYLGVVEEFREETTQSSITAWKGKSKAQIHPGGLLLQLAMDFLESCNFREAQLTVNNKGDLKGVFGKVLTYSLQLEPECRKSAGEIVETLDQASSCARRSQLDSEIPFKRTRTRLHEITNWRFSFNIPFEAQYQVQKELLEQTCRESSDLDTLMDLVFCYSEGFGDIIDRDSMILTLKTAAILGEWRAASLLVRLGGKLSKDQGFLHNCIQVIQPLPELPKLFLFCEPKSPLERTQEAFWNTLLRERARVSKEEALRTFDGDRLGLIITAIPGLLEELEDPWNIRLRHCVLRNDAKELEELKTHKRSAHSTWDARNLEFETPLLRASKYGLAAAVEFLLGQGAIPSLSTESGVMPLHLLGMFEAKDVPTIARKLAPAGFPFNSIAHAPMLQVFCHFWGTPLHWAIQMRSVPAVKAILDLGADIDFAGARRAPLELATELFAYEIVDLLLERGAKTSRCRLVHGELKPFPCLHAIGDLIPLHQAILPRRLMHGRRLEEAVGLTIKAYLRHGIGVNVCDYKGSTALLAACLNPAPNDFVLKALIENGADIHRQQDDAVEKVMSSAKVFTGSEATALPKLHVLLEHMSFSDVNRYDKNRFTYLHMCAALNLPSMMAALISRGAIVNAVSLNYRDKHPIHPSKFRCDDRLQTPLGTASALDSLPCVQVLLAAGANVNVLTGIEGQGLPNTPLATAVVYGKKLIVDEIMKANNVSIWLPQIGSERPSVLNLPHFHHFCPLSDRTKIIMHLLWEYGSKFARKEVLHATLAGFNPMHQAISLGDRTAVQRLLEAGTDPNSVAIVGNDDPFKRPKLDYCGVESPGGRLHIVPLRDYVPEMFVDRPSPRRLPQPGPISSLQLALVLRHTPETEWSQEPTPEWLEANLGIIRALLDAGARVTDADAKSMAEKGDHTVAELVASRIKDEKVCIHVKAA